MVEAELEFIRGGIYEEFNSHEDFSANDKLLYFPIASYSQVTPVPCIPQKCCASLWDVYTDGNTDGTETQQQQHILCTWLQTANGMIHFKQRYIIALQIRALIWKPANENQDFYPRVELYLLSISSLCPQLIVHIVQHKPHLPGCCRALHGHTEPTGMFGLLLPQHSSTEPILWTAGFPRWELPWPCTGRQRELENLPLRMLLSAHTLQTIQTGWRKPVIQGSLRRENQQVYY